MWFFSLVLIGNLRTSSALSDDELANLRAELYARPCCLDYENNLKLEWWERLIEPLPGTEIAMNVVRNDMTYNFDSVDEGLLNAQV